MPENVHLQYRIVEHRLPNQGYIVQQNFDDSSQLVYEVQSLECLLQKTIFVKILETKNLNVSEFVQQSNVVLLFLQSYQQTQMETNVYV